ncbi:MAG: ATP-binding cassette domain-containing protein [Clostridiales bacterium]|nr:ATP-binding cassette domain-containing protein [Clostridiales bacterium]
MLTLKNICFSAVDENNHQKDILKNVSLTVDTGSFVVITGPNGGGKSTLSKIIMGLEPSDSGDLIFDGENITGLDITQRARRGIGFAFQQPVRFKGLDVKALLQYAAGRSLTTAEACEYLSQVGLCAMDYINRELNASLSGGEMKRIEIAILIARNVKLSIFDEPEAGIDLWSFHNLIEVFQKLRRETNGSIIIISHQERILEIADKIVVIADGVISAQGRREDILPSLLGNPDTCKFYKREA